MSVYIRNATINDLNAINEIYNYYVLNSTSTAQEVLNNLSERTEWYNVLIAKRLPIIVAEINSEIVGWGSLCMFNERSAYRFCVEDSIYIDKTHLCRSIGSLIMQELIKRAKESGFKTIIAKICSEQQSSIKFHEKYGFRKVGLLENVMFKFNRNESICIMQIDF